LPSGPPNTRLGSRKKNLAVNKSATTAIAIVGGGIAGLAAAYELARQGADFILFEASTRLGGIVETIRIQDFLIECGPDSWVTEKPWAAELAIELGLRDQIVLSNDQQRTTYIEKGRRLIALPEGMRMMVPTQWESQEGSPLFSAEAQRAYREEPERAAELRASAPQQDETIACFVRRHFGEEVAETIAAPLLSGVFGGDIKRLSVRAIMPTFVKMEADYGSVIAALQQRSRRSLPQPIFSTLAGGMEVLVDRIASGLPARSVRLRQPVTRMRRDEDGWSIATAAGEERFQSVLLATPPEATRALLQSLESPTAAGSAAAARMAELLPQRCSSAIVVALGFTAERAAGMSIPRGFGFLVPAAPARSGDDHRLLACTFVDQKFPGRVPDGAALLRAFFGGEAGAALQKEPEDALIRRTREQLASLLGPMPEHSVALVRRLPHSLPQYEVGHLERTADLESLALALPGLRLTGSAYHGVGVSDLIREGRAAARAMLLLN